MKLGGAGYPVQQLPAHRGGATLQTGFRGCVSPSVSHSLSMQATNMVVDWVIKSFYKTGDVVHVMHVSLGSLSDRPGGRLAS